ncbi:MAG: helix-turn-helix domain-containing protein [Pseudomonadota bacterium]
MLEVSIKEREMARSILVTFSQYGFRKTSMEEIAKAAGLSRQSIYKKFGSKEKCYRWTIKTYLDDIYTRIFAVFNRDHLPAQHILMDMFDILIGEAIIIVRNAHGTEVLRDVLEVTHFSEEDWPLRLKTRLANFLVKQHWVSEEKALGMAFTLISAGKGLLLIEPNREDFLKDMQIMIDTIAPRRIDPNGHPKEF